MRAHHRAWERDYRRRGRLWRGIPSDLPDLPDGARVLELGCGNGKTLSAMLPRPWHVVAMDVSPGAVELCVALLAREASRTAAHVELLVADACSLPFGDRAFDAVLAFHVVGHGPLPERRQMAAEIGRVLAPGGRAFFRGFGTGDMRRGKGEEVENGTFIRNGILTHYFTEEEVAALFDRLSLESVRTDRWGTRIMGRMHPREVVEATFVKTGR